MCIFHERSCKLATTPAWALSRGIEMAKTENRNIKKSEGRRREETMVISEIFWRRGLVRSRSRLSCVFLLCATAPFCVKC